jgi:hypothetical protein
MEKKIIIMVLMLVSTIFLSGCTETDNNFREYVEGKFITASMENVNFSKEIADDGSVSYDNPSYEGDITYYNWTKTYNLTISNNQSSYVDVFLIFYNPNKSSTRGQGLHDNLEVETLSIFSTKYKFAFYGYDYYEKYDKEDWNWADGRADYNDNWLFAERIYPNKNATIPITFSITKSYPGTFQDGQYYICYFYIASCSDHLTYQIQEIPFVVET